MNYFKKTINTVVSNIFSQDLPNRSNAFEKQKKLLSRLIASYNNSPLYQIVGLKQEEFKEISMMNSLQIKELISVHCLCDYKNHIVPLLSEKKGLSSLRYDLCIKTSGTSDANKGGKLIPAQWSSFDNEIIGIKRTISSYIQENPLSNLLYRSYFSLTAPFDLSQNIGYVSGSIKKYSGFFSNIIAYPFGDGLLLHNWQLKKKFIVDQLLTKQPKLGSIHGVPTRPLEIIDEMIYNDRQLAKKVFSDLEYVSIGGGPPLHYKQDFQNRLLELGLSQRIAGSNNHNASEGFLGSQIRNFFDLDFHRMSPLADTNFFLFVPVSLSNSYNNSSISFVDLVFQSHLLHEVEYGMEYLMMIANDRIPWLYNIKDRVLFQHNDGLPYYETPLEYIVTGRYGMSSNLFNEHIEVEHLEYAIKNLLLEGYHIDQYNFLAGMELSDNNGIFHIVVESAEVFDISIFTTKLDSYLSIINDQRRFFRERGKISNISIVIFPLGYVRKRLIDLGKMHEQAKIPHLSDDNYIHIIKPFLSIP